VVSTSDACPSGCDAERFWRSHVRGTTTTETYAVTYRSRGQGTWTQTRTIRDGKAVETSSGDVTGSRGREAGVDVANGQLARLAGSTVACRAFVPGDGPGAGRPTFDCGPRADGRHAPGSYGVEVGGWGVAAYHWNATGTHATRVRTALNPSAPRDAAPPRASSGRVFVIPENAWAHLAGTRLYCDATRDFKTQQPVFLCRLGEPEVGPSGPTRSWEVEVGAHLLMADQLDVTGAPGFSFRSP
jgi:hypothetical protein